MKLKKTIIQYSIACIAIALLLSACEADDPVREDVPEMITKVSMAFTPNGGGPVIIATATDPDGDGIQDLEIDGEIILESDTEYVLEIELINGLAQPGTAEYDVTDEVSEEGAEHMFFFAWTGNLFSDPEGDGNVDDRADAVNYEDEDVEGNPLGLRTTWTTGAAASGDLRVILKHQPDLKSATSDVNTGETDLDIAFPVVIQ